MLELLAVAVLALSLSQNFSNNFRNENCLKIKSTKVIRLEEICF